MAPRLGKVERGFKIVVEIEQKRRVRWGKNVTEGPADEQTDKLILGAGKVETRFTSDMQDDLQR